MNISFFLFIILVSLFFLNPGFFDTTYNNKLGRFILVISLVIISLDSILLAILLLIVIILLSQNKKKVKPPVNKIIEEKDEALPIGEVVKKTIDKKHDDNFLFKKYDKNLYKKSKRDGVNVVQVSELIRPKSSKVMVIVPNTPNIQTVPYSKENYYKI
jgi:Flp pilus assembly protein TadB